MELDRPRSASPNLQPPRDLLVPELLPHHDHQSHVPTLMAPTPRRERDYIEGQHLHPVPSPVQEVDSRTLTPIISSSQLPLSSLSFQSLAKPTAQPNLHWGLGLLSTAARLLFPTLVGTRRKSVLGMGASILAAPAVFMLTLTLPVVISHPDLVDSAKKENALQGDPAEGGDGEDAQAQRQGDRVEAQNQGREGRLIDLDSPRPHEDGQILQYSQSHASLVSYASHSASASEHDMDQLIDDAEEEIEQELHGGIQFNKYLTAIQLILGPAFCVTVCFVNMTRYLPWLLFAAFVSGASMSALVLVFSQDGKHPVVRTALCLIGFVVAMVWIMAIADEVVQVLNVSNHSLFDPQECN
jgi:sodium/potassium/calcium exchanger 6